MRKAEINLNNNYINYNNNNNVIQCTFKNAFSMLSTKEVSASVYNKISEYSDFEIEKYGAFNGNACCAYAENTCPLVLFFP